MLLIPATAILPHVHSYYTSLMSVQLWQTSVFQPTVKKGRCLEKKKKNPFLWSWAKTGPFVWLLWERADRFSPEHTSMNSVRGMRASTHLSRSSWFSRTQAQGE